MWEQPFLVPAQLEEIFHISIKFCRFYLFQARAEGGGGLLGAQAPAFFIIKIIQKCPSQTNSNDILVNKMKCIWYIINKTMCTKQ